MTHIGVIGGFQRELSIKDIRRDISRLARHLFSELHGALPYMVQFLIVQRRAALRRLVHKSLVRLRRIAKPLDDATGKVRHRGVAPAFRYACHNRLRQLVDCVFPFHPDHLRLVAAIDEPGRVHGVVIEEGILEHNLLFDTDILFRICTFPDWKIYMEPWPGGSAFFLFSMVPGKEEGHLHIRERQLHFGGRHPLRGFFCVVVVAVHHQAIRCKEIVYTAVTVLERSADMVTLHGLPELFFIGDLMSVRIKAVFLVARTVR